MINENSVRAVDGAVFGEEFRRPLYDSYCFSRIPATIEGLLTGRGGGLPDDALVPGRYDVVIVLFVDAFGWRFFEKYGERYPFLKQFLTDGVASKITSQFPSTTAPHVTCMNTGLHVGASGIYEWFHYEPRVDKVIVPLLFTPAGDKVIGALSKEGVLPEEIFPFETFHERLKAQGIDSYVMQDDEISHSHFSKVMFRGAHSIPFATPEEGLRRLAGELLSPLSKPSYFFFYFGEIDSMGHHEGVHSAAFEQKVDLWWRAVEANLWGTIRKSSKKIATIVIADHGMTEVNPETTFYLNEELPELLPWIKRNRAGELLVPAGSCRDFFLHIREEHLEEAESRLKEALAGRALVTPVKTLIDEGFFGKASPRLLERVGNLVVLPFASHSVWWHEKGRFSQLFHGAHGGLTPAEMDTVFLIC